MNDLTRYNLMRSQFQPGDLLAFYGGSPLSWAIRLFAAGPSHVALIRQGYHYRQGGPTIIESTIENGRNGVQTNVLMSRLLEYNGSVAWLPLSADSRKKFDLQKFYAFCGASEDSVKYDKGGLFEFLYREIPIIGVRVAQTANPKEMVCSGWACAVDIAAGLLSHRNWDQVKPQEMIELNLYDRWVPLVGNPKPTRFNTI